MFSALSFVAVPLYFLLNHSTPVTWHFHAKSKSVLQKNILKYCVDIAETFGKAAA